MTGIYCIEWAWGKNYSVKKPLSLVAKVHNVSMIHRAVETPEEFDKFLSTWSRRITKEFSYAILYLGFHGFPKAVQVGTGSPLRKYVRWEQIADLVADRGAEE